MVKFFSSFGALDKVLWSFVLDLCVYIYACMYVCMYV